ncbi:MAG: host-nuclease inhibitor Gam family protein [Opitutaceae bacterium]|nr:host-nuclease inhibitor Gam family protein [Opitutaceae bacterium]
MTRLTLPQFKSRDEFTAAVDAAARITVDLRKLEAVRDARIQAVQAEYSDPVEAMQALLTVLVAQAEKFAEEHQCELMLGKARSAETALARYGFRTGMPQLKLLAKWTWEEVVECLDSRGLSADFIRVKREPDKAAMIAALTTKGILGESTEPALVGVRLVQAETFYIEPKVDGAEQIKSTSAK